MTNLEAYKDVIETYKKRNGFCEGFVKPKILKIDDCNGMDCYKCPMLQMIWLLEEYEEEVDWSKVEVDTPIIVSNNNEIWEKEHFAKYENGMVFAWVYGKTSHTTKNTTSWHYAKLADEGDKDD